MAMKTPGKALLACCVTDPALDDKTIPIPLKRREQDSQLAEVMLKTTKNQEWSVVSAV